MTLHLSKQWPKWTRDLENSDLDTSDLENSDLETSDPLINDWIVVHVLVNRKRIILVLICMTSIVVIQVSDYGRLWSSPDYNYSIFKLFTCHFWHLGLVTIIIVKKYIHSCRTAFTISIIFQGVWSFEVWVFEVWSFEVWVFVVWGLRSEVWSFEVWVFDTPLFKQGRYIWLSVTHDQHAYNEAFCLDNTKEKYTAFNYFAWVSQLKNEVNHLYILLSVALGVN